jgi:hypothetical protein
MFNIQIKESFYNKQKQKDDETKNEQYKRIAKYIDKIIDSILDEFEIRNNTYNGTYCWHIDEIQIKISYTTNIYGEQPRYEVNISKPCDEYGYYNMFSYYHGEIYQFTAPFQSVNTFRTVIDINKIQFFIDSVQWLLNNKKISCKKKVTKYLNKLV